MAGVTIGGLDRETLGFIVHETAPGGAFLVRTAALAAAALLAFAVRGALGCRLVAAAAGCALATLAWTGHAVAGEGVPAGVHRASDVVHLLAASAWVGALLMLLTALASAGSVLVALIVVSGLVNGLMIVGPAALPQLPATHYGQLLIGKLLLFGVMLGFAGRNRWRLAPRLAAAQEGGQAARAVRALRISIALEAGFATLILGLVAWLGTLAPPTAP